MINYYENPEILHVNTEEYRCWYIPQDMEGMERRLMLNGMWRFRYFESPEEAERELEKDSNEGELIPVPSNWQYQGYDFPQYINTRYPFPYDPPYVPYENPCGLYEREVLLTEADMKERLYLNFEGVDSCFYIWWNGAFVGYSQISHAVSEFDISQCVQAGVNTVRVLVLKWCDGSYLEDQDKFRVSGIFRDVYVLKRPQNFIRDYTVHTEFAEGMRRAELSVEMECTGTPEVKCSLYDPDGIWIADASPEDYRCSFTVDDPVLWNAEYPKLYTLRMESEEVICQKIGMRSVSVKRDQLLVNGQPVKMKGVNRHDSSPFHGAAVTKEEMLKDLRLMKEHNINAIRTSHYPAVPWFIQKCDEYGFYVMEEADIETQGCGETYCTEDRDSVSLLTRDPQYAKAMLDRVQSMVYRDRNSASVIFWSLGNESGYGPNLEEAGRWVKEYDPSRLLHYESGTWELRRPADVSMLDVVSRMYAPLSWINTYCREHPEGKPFIHCEFSHAMGNGPGDLEEYYDQMYALPNHAGGYVWEWCDHGVYRGEADNRKAMYWYGGDFGEMLHDRQFCMDGLVYPDRTPHTGLLELKNVARPVRVKSWCGHEGVLLVQNCLDFLNLKDYAELHYEWKRDGSSVLSGRIESVEAEPHEEVRVPVEVPEDLTGNLYLMVTYIRKYGDELTEEGSLMGFDQIEVSRNRELPELEEGGGFVCRETGREYEVSGAGFSYTFCRHKGVFTSIIRDGEEILVHPVRFQTYRAPADNDKEIMLLWQEAGYDRADSRAYESNIREKEGRVEIRARMSMAAISLQPFLRMDICWTIDAQGAIGVGMKAEFDMEFPFLPRFGIEFPLKRSFREVEYFGYGPEESYCDKHHSAYIDRFKTTVDSMHEDYIRPQENGSRFDCSYAQICSDVTAMRVSAVDSFSFQASDHRWEDLARVKHNYELTESDCVSFCIDYMQSGLGSASCGPELADVYKLHQEHITWEFIIQFQEVTDA